MGFLGSFANSVRNLGSKALGAVQAVGQKVSDVAGKVGSVATSIAPSLSQLPVVGGVASKVAGAVGNIAQQVSNRAGTASLVAGGLRHVWDNHTLGQAPPMEQG